MDSLTELAIKYKADKWGKHTYTPVYYDLFKDKCDTVKKVLEIGVAEGASLFMWRDFFPNAIIYGADNDLDRVNNLQGLDRIKVFEVDQSSEEDLIRLIDEIGDDLDLVVDDGSHKPNDQINTCLTLMPILSKKVIYVIEDVADKKIIDKLPSKLTELKRLSKRYDDQLIICRK